MVNFMYILPQKNSKVLPGDSTMQMYILVTNLSIKNNYYQNRIAEPTLLFKMTEMTPPNQSTCK